MIPSPKYSNELSNRDNKTSGAAVSPMPGVVDKILVNKGDSVKTGDSLIVIVAMKMEIRSLKIKFFIFRIKF